MLHTLLSQRALATPGKVALIQGQRRVTYGELGQNVSRLAAFLVQSGIGTGERIGILSKNSPEYVAAYFGIQKAGCIAVDINFQNSVHEVRAIVKNSALTALIAENSRMDAVAAAIADAPSVRTVIGIERRARNFKAAQGKIQAPVRYAHFTDIVGRDPGAIALPAVSERDIASIIYTSGTTGKPKGVMLSHENLLANARSIVEYLKLCDEDKVMVVLPFCYSYGKSLLTTHVMAGGALVLENSFMYPNMVFDTMIKEEVTGFAGVPSTFAIMLNRSNFRQYRFPKLRYMTQAGGAMPPQHARELADWELERIAI